MKLPFVKAVAARTFAATSALATGVTSLWLIKRYLLPEEFGVVGVALQLMIYLPFLDGGFRTIINRKLLAESRGDESDRLLEFSQTFYSYLSLVVAACGVLLMLIYSLTPNAKASGLPLQFFVGLGLAGAAAVVSSMQLGLLVGFQAQAQLALLTGIGSWIGLGTLWWFLRQGAGLYAFIFSSLLMVIGTFPVGVALIKKRMPGFRLWRWNLKPTFWSDFKKWRGEAWACFRGQVAVMLLFTSDVVIVGLICTAEEAGIYLVLARVFSIVRSLLQSAGDAAWPIVAQSNLERGATFSFFLLRLNGWVYGSVMGAFALTIKPFLSWFMGEQWAVSQTVLWMMVGRFLISGISSPAAYHLLGTGDFKSIAHYIQRELILAVALALPLGFKFGLPGVAGAFLLATTAGTLGPILVPYAKAIKISAAKVGWIAWWRAGVGFFCAIAISAVLMMGFKQPPSLIFIGAIGAVGGVLVGLLVSYLRLRRNLTERLMSLRLREIIRGI